MLQNKDGRVIAKDIIKGINADWKKYAVTFNVGETDAKAQLVIEPLSEGTVWFDVVSMFPEKTYLNRINGLRYDLAKKIEEFKPGFIRFPGGCIVEGATLENRVKWKNTLGDISNRPGHWVLWDYYSTDGLGFHEYLQFCEDLKTPECMLPQLVCHVSSEKVKLLIQLRYNHTSRKRLKRWSMPWALYHQPGALKGQRMDIPIRLT